MDMTDGDSRLSAEEMRRVRDAEARLEQQRLRLDEAAAEGRLADEVGKVPPVREQLQRFLNEPA
jgi:hypothetical protein